MNSAKEAWDAKAKEYVRRVEAALAGVAHPRKGQVVDDLANHLEDIYANLPEDRRTAEEFAKAIENMGPPEEYAELLAETAAPRPRAWLRLAVVCLAVGLAGFILYSAFWADPESRADTLCFFGRGYNPPPFFNVDGFNSITPGMSDAEVRDLIGYPCNRYSLVGKEQEVKCEYSAPLFDGARHCNQFTVVFSRDTRTVIRTEYEKKGMPAWMSPPGWIKAHSGPLTLTRADGANLVLSASDSKPYIIRFDTDAQGRTPQEIFDYGQKAAETVAAYAEDGAFEIVHLYVGSQKVAFAAVSPQAYTGWSRMLERGEMDSRLAAYAGGTLYFLPPIFGGIHAEDCREDQAWLVRKLAEEAQ